MDKKYKNVSELVSNVFDRKNSKEINEHLQNKKISKLLFTMRCAAGISQKEMASRLKCTQSKISKIEHCSNDNIKIKDLTDYSKTLNLQLGISFASRKRTTVDSIKFHAFKIKDHLDKLADMPKGDDEMFKGVSGFFGEYFFNMLNFFQKSVIKLEKNKPLSKETIQITAPIDVHEKKFEELFSVSSSIITPISPPGVKDKKLP